MSDSRIYSAVYSGVAVYETVANDVAVMRRRNDSYMNATQILKVAGIEKGKRTKILEREVLIGEHEKVQGGYGKFQGTWIPLDKSRQLAERYGVLEMLKYIIDFIPPAGGDDNEENQLPTKEQAMIAQRRLAQQQQQQQQQHQQQHQHQLRKHHHQPPPPPPSTQQQQHLPPPSSSSQQQRHHYQTPDQSHNQYRPGEEPNRKRVKIEQQQQQQLPPPTGASTDEHRSLLTAIFLSDDSEHIRDLLKNTTPTNFNIDLVIDEQGNTALHWAAALARTTIVQLLVSKGANPACVNYAGETPLMRSVMVTNSFDNNSFPTLLAALGGTVNAIDHIRQTVLHHAAKTAGIHGRTSAAVYYVNHLLHLQPLSILDWQDHRGDTALNIAAQLECPELVDMLARAGAKKDVENNVGLTAEDYNEDKNTPIEDSEDHQRQQQSKPNVVVPSERGREIVSTVQKIVDALDEEYGGQLNQRDSELQQIESELEHATKELETTRKDLEARQTQSQRLVEAQQRFRNLQAALQTEWDRMTITPVDTITALDELVDTQDVDAPFAPTQDETKSEPLTRRVKILRARIAAYKQNDQELRAEVEEQRAQSAEKELQCKKLIAACCNLPIEKIDDLVEPLILAIESDPPDLDLARVIGFMEKIRRQGAFSDSLTSSQSSSPPTTAAAVPATTAPTPPSISGHTTTLPPPVSPTEPVVIPNDHPSTPNSNITEQ